MGVKVILFFVLVVCFNNMLMWFYRYCLIFFGVLKFFMFVVLIE